MEMFTVVGASRVRANAPMKLRLANGKPARRARVLERNGHADIQLFETAPMAKDQALAWLAATHPTIASQLATKVVVPKVTVAVAVAEKAAPKRKVVVTDTAVELSPAAKLAAKRAKDAARKREKRAAEKAAKAA